MIKVSARKLLLRDSEELWENLRGRFILVYDDREVVTHWKEAILTWYGLRQFKEYPHVPVVSSCHCTNFMPTGGLSVATMTEMLCHVIFHIYDHSAHLIRVDHPENRYKNRSKFMERLYLMIYRINNRAYNELTIHLEEFVDTIDPEDILEILDHEGIREVKKNAAPTVDGTNEIYKVITEALKNDPVLRKNAAATAVRLGTVNLRQALQLFGRRGFLPEVNGQIFPNPIKGGFCDGFRLLVDVIMESSACATALMAAGDDLRTSQYGARRLSINAGVVEKIVDEDCGSGSYLLWKVRGDVRHSPTQVTPGDLRGLAGKYYLDDDGLLKVVRKTDTHLIGRTLKLRSAFMGCGTREPGAICAVCFSEGYLQIPEGTDIGPTATNTVTEKSAQELLGKKHVIASEAMEGIRLDQFTKKFFSAEYNGSVYYINPKIIRPGLKMRISAPQVSGLSDIHLENAVQRINTARVSSIVRVTFEHIDDHGVITLDDNVKVNAANRQAMFTREALAYLRDDHYENMGTFVEIDLADWDPALPFFQLDNQQDSASDRLKKIMSIIEGTVAKSEERSTQDPADLLMELFDLLNERLGISLALLEVIMLSVMATNPSMGNYAIPKEGDERVPTVLDTAIQNRSLAGYLCYEGFNKGVQNPDRFLVDPIGNPASIPADHPLDVIINPKEVIAHMRKTGALI